MDCLDDSCQAQSQPKDQDVAAHLTGILVILNSLIPTILWWLWRNPSGNITQTEAFYNNKIYLYGWVAMWIGHLTVYGLPSLFYLGSLFQVDEIKYAYVMTMNTIQQMPFVLFFFTSLMLVVGAVNRTEAFKLAEVWSVAAAYIAFATVTGFVQVYYNRALNEWYYDNLDDVKRNSDEFDEYQELQEDPSGVTEFLQIM